MLIERTVDEHSAAFRLGSQGADGFASRMRVLVDSLDEVSCRAAAEQVMGFVSDDVGEDVRGWVVSQGRQVYQGVVERPETLTVMLEAVDTEDELALGESLLHLEGRDQPQVPAHRGEAHASTRTRPLGS